MMKTVLITGMSGTGKTTVINELALQGYAAVDLDNDRFSVWADAEEDPDQPDNEVRPGKDWIWNTEAVQQLLSGQHTNPLFVSGCASNMARFYPQFTHIILLAAPAAVLVQRLRLRQQPAYGHTDEEINRILRLKQSIEPLLKQAAGLEIDTSLPLPSVIAAILRYTATQ